MRLHLPGSCRIDARSIYFGFTAPAAERRKNAAHGASRGKLELNEDQPQRGERTSTLEISFHFANLVAINLALAEVARANKKAGTQNRSRH